MMSADDFSGDFSEQVMRTFADMNADILVAHILASEALRSVIRSSRWRDELCEEIRANARGAILKAPFPDDPSYQGMRKRTVERALARLDAIFDEMGHETSL